MTATTTARAPRTAAATSTAAPTPEPLSTESLRAELARRFAERSAAMARLGPGMAHLWELAAEHAQGGKLLRPRLLLAAHDAMSEATGTTAASQAEVLRLASALELLHFAFLLHDDVIDGDLFRRGHLNLVGTLSAERETGRTREDSSQPTPEGLHRGQTGAILAGDLLLSQVHQMVARAEVDPPVRTALLDLLDEAILVTVAGEHADVALSDGTEVADLDTILTTAARKTAAYSFALPLRMAAALTDGPAAWHPVLDRAATHLGLAFQLQDDYLSVFGDPARHGKDACSDLREGKQTAIIAYARLTSAWPQVHEHVGNRGLTPEAAQDVVGALRSCGADRFVLGLVAEHREALAALLEESARSQAPLPAAVRELLGALDAELVGRAS